jgi:hypothetical protein
MVPKHPGIPFEQIVVALGLTRIKFEEIRTPREADRLFGTGQSGHSRYPATGAALQLLVAIHRLADTGAGVKTPKGQSGEKRLRVGDFRVRFTEEGGEQMKAPGNEGTLRIHAVRSRKDAYR